MFKKFRLYILFCFLLISGSTIGQTPTTCFEIESILVDACGDPEGENEMVRFRVGPNPLNISNMFVDWPNNTWLGACQNAITAAKVVELNSTITACGLILEPPSGIIPPGANVILVTSTNFSTAANSFAGLNDTLYIVFQCQGNTSGHFANATGSGIRTLTIDFGLACSDAVSYSCNQLLDIFGNTGAAAATLDRDGAAVNYTWAGSGTYLNQGCVAPFVQQTINAGLDQEACEGDTIQLFGLATGNFISTQWSGGNGTWLNSNQLNATYIVGPGESGTITLILSGITCSGAISDSLLITEFPLPQINTIPPVSSIICDGQLLVLDAGQGGPFIWSTGQTTPSISVNSSGVYYVNSVNQCGDLSDTVFFNVMDLQVTAQFTVDSLSGTSPLLVQFTNQSTGANLYEWIFDQYGSSAEESPSFTFVHPGENVVTLVASNSNGCLDTTSLIIEVLACPSRVFIPNSFTPNFDEINPEFFVVSNCTFESRMTIFDRWGREVYSWTDLSLGWNGNSSWGYQMPIGIYTYLLEIVDLNGNRSNYRGQINLIR